MTTNKGQRVTDTPDMLPERRAVSTVQALQALGLNPAIIILVAFCFVIVWYTLEKSNKDEGYSRQMITLVSNIQADLQYKNKQDAEFRIAVMTMINRNTEQINGVTALLKTLGWPLGVDAHGKSYIQTDKDRAIFNAEQLQGSQ